MTGVQTCALRSVFLYLKNLPEKQIFIFCICFNLLYYIATFIVFLLPNLTLIDILYQFSVKVQYDATLAKDIFILKQFLFMKNYTYNYTNNDSNYSDS